ncbi:hypothetical protein ABZW03_23205 [Kitasatospora sp. NPDC004799]|uniref:Ig-like domain-containing protein n=1 Tax=Kitasatospora sp. NPDC004799 TaxID=3154460 RepID=UPI0033A3096E
MAGAGGRNVVRTGRLVRVAASVVVLALAAGCGGGGGGSSATTTPAPVLPTAETPVPTGSAGSDPSAIASLFPGSKGGTAVSKATLPATPLGEQVTKTMYIVAPPITSEAGTGTGTDSGTTIGDVHLPAGSFSVVSNPCTGRTLRPGESCPLTVAFSPTTVGTHSAELTVDTSATDSDYRVELVGEGLESGSSSPSPSSPSNAPTPWTTSSPEVTPTAEEPSAEETAG